MNYKKIYDTLILRGQNRIKDTKTYYERHHIIPKCLDGTNADINLVYLTAREHYIAHGLLVKIYKNNNIAFRKLIYSFRYMSVDSHNGNRRNNRDYAWMRKLYSKNHPMHDKNISKKTSEGLKQAWKDGKFEYRKVERKTYLCACGCGKTFIKKITEKRKYFSASHCRWNNGDIESKKLNQSFKLQEHISSLTKEQLKQRMKNSFGSADPVARGKAISLAKKGKKTNQSQKEAEKYGKMLQIEFDEYIKDRTTGVKSRMTKRRNNYLNGTANSNNR